MSNGFGTSYSITGSTFKERAKVMAIKPGPSKDQCSHNYIRIAPPMLQQANNLAGWRMWHNIHFGYEGPGKDPGKNTPRTFVCPRKEQKVNGEWRVVQGCDECTKNEQMAQARKAAEVSVLNQANAAMAAGQPVSEQQIKEAVKAACKQYNDYLKCHNLQRGYWVNGWSPELNAPVRCRLNAKACNKVIKLIEDYRNRGIDALALDQGLLFDVRRYGDGFGTEDEVVIVTEDQVINGMNIPMPKRFPLTPEMQQRLLSECQDLGDPSPSVYLTPEQVAELVRLGDEDVEAVDRFFKRTQAERKGDGGSAPRVQNPLVPAAPVAAERIPSPPSLPQAAPVTPNMFAQPQTTMGNPPPPSFIQGDQNPFLRAVAAPNFRPGEPTPDQMPEFKPPTQGFGSTPAPAVPPRTNWTAEELMNRLGLTPKTNVTNPAEAVEKLLKDGK